MLKKIGIKLIGVVGITAILIMGIFAYYNIRSHSKNLLAEVERHANQLSETVKYSTQYDMLLNQRDRIHNVIKTIAKQPNIERIRVLNKSGAIIYSSDERDIGRMVDKRAESCYGCHSADRPLERLSITERTRIYRIHPDSARILGIINPIYNEPSCWSADCHAHLKEQTVLGVLDVSMSLDEVDRRIQQSEIEIGVFAVSAILAISLIIGLFVERWIDAPVKDLLDATRQVANGNLHYTIKEKQRDELGQLARSFNNMTQKLADARLQLFQSDKMASLGRLAAGVAHEINNPLTGVLTYSSYLLKRAEEHPALQEDLKVIVRETLRSREIVKSLLDFARQSVPKKAQADINEIINHSLSVVEKQLSLNHIKLIKQLDVSLPKITVDSNQMEQVFINLLVNASDALPPEGGTITLTSALLHLSPFGIAQIKNAVCQKRHSLINNEVKIDGLPSLMVKARSSGNEGFIYLDPVYGSHRHQYGIEIQMKKEFQIVCPECGNSLVDPHTRCPRCQSNVISFEVPSKGMYETCIKKECGWQRWEAVDSGGQREYVEITVKDTGCGIPKEELQKIFEPFYSTKGQKGTGLGLAVLWGIVDNHNGTIHVASEVGIGTTFTLRLPLQQA